MNKEIDIVDRDPTNINKHLKIKFNDVIAEPDGTHSFDDVWSFSSICYTCFKDLVYGLLSCLFGLCIAAAWGCEFGTTAFEHIWCFTPVLKTIKLITFDTCQRCLVPIIRCCIKPPVRACARIFTACAPSDIDWNWEPSPPAPVKRVKIVQEPTQSAPVVIVTKKAEPDMYLGDKEKIKRSVHRQLLL